MNHYDSDNNGCICGINITMTMNVFVEFATTATTATINATMTFVELIL